MGAIPSCRRRESGALYPGRGTLAMALIARSSAALRARKFDAAEMVG
jgi:hypothetical protein